jgi:hypothetical protein
MSNLKTLIEGFRKKAYKRVQRSDLSYKQTDEVITSELERLLAKYSTFLVEDQEARLTRDFIELAVRRYHEYSIDGKFGGHYRQVGVDEKNCIFEHIIPINSVVAMLIEGRLTINQALNTPTCLIKKEDDVILRESGLGSSSPDHWNFFKRYRVLNSVFKTYNGQVIADLDTFTLEDHYNLFGVVP